MSKAPLVLNTSQIADRYVQENFIAILKYLRANTNLVGFRHLEITLTTATIGVETSYPHGLGYVPKDVLVTSTRGPSLISFNYAAFDQDNLYFTVVAGQPTDADPAILRAYVGTHQKGNQ